MYTDNVDTCKFQDVLFLFAVLMVTIQWNLCEKMSPKPGLKLFREDYKSVEETCLAVGFVRNNCSTSKTSLSIT